MYEVNIECANEEIARCIQDWVRRNFECDEIYWNAVKEVKN